MGLKIIVVAALVALAVVLIRARKQRHLRLQRREERRLRHAAEEKEWEQVIADQTEDETSPFRERGSSEHG
jgi:cell division protein FtsL